MLRFIQRLPFLPVVALLFGWAAGTVVLAMPAWQLDSVVRQADSALLPMLLRAPLNLTGRFIYASGAAFLVCFGLLLPSLIFSAIRRARRKSIAVPDWPARTDARGEEAMVPHASPLPEAPLPAFFGIVPPPLAQDVAEFLLDEAMALREPLGHEPEKLSLQRLAAPDEEDAPPPLRLHQPDPVFIRAPAPVQPSCRGEAAEGVVRSEPLETIPQLIDRIERSLKAKPPAENFVPPALRAIHALRESGVGVGGLV